MIRDIKDPEHPYTLEQLRVVSEENIFVTDVGDLCFIKIFFTPTVSHCSLANLIGLCIRERLTRYLHKPSKIDIFVTPGSHDTEGKSRLTCLKIRKFFSLKFCKVNKQINDKERIQAALENPYLYEMVETCLKDPE